MAGDEVITETREFLAKVILKNDLTWKNGSKLVITQPLQCGGEVFTQVIWPPETEMSKFKKSYYMNA